MPLNLGDERLINGGSEDSQAGWKTKKYSEVLGHELQPSRLVLREGDSE